MRKAEAMAARPSFRTGSLLRTARMLVITAAGASVLVIGAAMIVLPGPAFVVIPAGLAILGLEFAWARRWLETVRRQGGRALDAARGRGSI
jgi:tellurite resistance protein TerC